MPKYSVSSMFFHEYSCTDIFSFAGRAGSNALEFWPETPDFWLNGRKEDLIKEIFAGQREIEYLTIHAPVLDLNPCSVNQDVAEVSIKNTIDAVYLAKRLGAEVVTIHPGRRTAKRPAGIRDMERFQRYIERVGEVSADTDIKVALENMPPKINALFSTPGEMKDILEKEEWLYFTFDLAHAMTNRDDNPMKFIEGVSDRIVNIHISKNSGTKNHFPLEYDTTIGDILGTLSDSGYNGYLTLELEDLNLGRKMTSEEKISIVKEDIEYIRSIFDR